MSLLRESRVVHSLRIRAVLYSFDKWYFDVSTADGWQLLAYLANVHLLGFDQCRLSVAALRRETGERRSASCALSLAHGRREPEEVELCRGTLRLAREGGRIELAGDDLRVEVALELEPGELESRGLAVRRHARSGAIHWIPLALGARATGRIGWGNDEIAFSGAPAYVDYLSSTILPPLVPARDLFWARGRSDALSLTYTVLRGRTPGQEWARLVISRDGRPRGFDVELRGAAALAGVDGRSFAAPELRARAPGLAVMVHVEPVALAFTTDFFGEAAELGSLARGALRRLARAPRAVKYFARAHVRIDEDGESQRFEVPLFAEHVRFADALPFLKP